MLWQQVWHVFQAQTCRGARDEDVDVDTERHTQRDRQWANRCESACLHVICFTCTYTSLKAPATDKANKGPVQPNTGSQL